MLRRIARSGFWSVGASSKRVSAWRRTIFISCIAKLAPRRQRGEELGELVRLGIGEWRATLQSFGRARTEALGVTPREETIEQTSTVMVGLGIGLGMISLAEPELVDPRLLGTVAAILIGAVEHSPEVRDLLSEITRRREPS